MADFTVHDVVVQDQVRFSNGKAAKVTHVQFYVGEQGPFFHDFSAPDNSPALIQAFIQQKVADLRSIVERQY